MELLVQEKAITQKVQFYTELYTKMKGIYGNAVTIICTSMSSKSKSSVRQIILIVVIPKVYKVKLNLFTITSHRELAEICQQDHPFK